MINIKRSQVIIDIFLINLCCTAIWKNSNLVYKAVSIGSVPLSRGQSFIQFTKSVPQSGYVLVAPIKLLPNHTDSCLDGNAGLAGTNSIICTITNVTHTAATADMTDNFSFYGLYRKL